MDYLRVALVCGALVASGCDHREHDAAAVSPAPPKPPTVVATAPSTPALAPAPAPEAEAEPSTDAECTSGESCRAAAAALERQKQPERAEPLYLRACDLGVGQACNRLGELRLKGKGVAPDDAKARELFELGCRQGSAAACDALGH